MKKLLALLTAAVATLTSAWAATPVAVWDRDFSTTEKNGYTFAANGNTVGPDGSTLIINRNADTTKAATITWETAFNPITVIVRHNGLPAYSGLMTLATVKVGTQMNQAGVCLDGSDYHTVGYWQGSMQGRATGENVNPAAGCYVFNYNPLNNTFPKGTNLKTLINGEVTSVHAEPGCVGTGNTMTGICIGGNGANKNSNYTGLEITGVAIFNANLTDEEIAAYEWPSDKIYKRYEANFTNRIMTWTTAAASASTSVDIGGASTFIGSKASYQGNQNTTALPGCTDSTLAWRGFCNGQTGYNAPGLVLRIPAYAEGKTVKIGGTFSPFSLGGLIVEEGASVGETWAALDQTSGTRTTALGDPRTSGGVPTFFTINDNFQIKRANGDVTIYGDVTIDIAEGKVFDCNTTYSNYSVQMNAGTAAKLRMVGAGKMKVVKIWADRAVTLDFSAQTKNNAEAVIEGPVTVNASTTINLPAGMTVGDSYKVASSIIGTIDPTNILVDGVVDSDLAWTIEDGALVATQAPDVVKIDEVGYTSLGKALEAVEGETTLTLAADIIGRGETIPAGVTIELAGHEITGTLDINAGAVITDGGVAKIDGIATNFDITFNHKEDIGKSGSQNGTIDYAGVSGMNVRFDNAFELVNLDEAGEVTKNTGAHLKNHPYVQGITGFYRNTDHLSFAVVGTMPNAKNTTFIHMGESRTGNDGGYGLLIATGSKDDEVIVAWNKGTEIHEISRMSVPNAASSRHVYIITKDDDRDADTSTFTVYLDGQKWKTIVQSPRFMIVGGLQVGSDFGGIIKDAYNRASETDKAKYFRQSAAEDGGVINVIRAYDRIITSAEIAQYSVPSEYPYVSPNGSSARTVEGSVNWISETAEWSNTPAGENTATLETAPLAGAIDLTASAAATISVNLEADATCEALTLKESAMSFVKGGEGAIIPTAATIGVPVTLVPTALDLSATKTKIVGDGKIIADYSGYDVKSIYTEKSVFVTGEIDQQAEGVVTATLPTHTYRTIGELTYNTTTHQYGFTVAPVMVDVTIPSIEHTTVSVAAGTLNCTITEGVASVPGGADITITYAPVAGYHFTAETPVTSVTASDVTVETQIDVADVTAVEINKYTVPVMHVENATTYVSIGGDEFEVVTDATIQVAHGKSYSAKYVANEGYMLVLPEGDTEPFKTEGYNYGSVTANMSDYPVHCAAVKIAAKIGETPYATVQAAIDALVEGETTLADITVVDKTATLPEGYEDYKIDEDGKIVLDIPSKPTVIVTKTTVEGLHAAYTYTFGELTQEQKDYYGDWTADYIVSFNKAVAADTVVLSGQYDGNGEEWVNLTLGAKGANEEFGLIAAALEQTGWTGVTVNFTFLLENVGTFNCGIKNLSKDNEDTEMTVKLVLSKDGETIVIGDEDGVTYKIDATVPQGPTSWEETTPSEVIELPEGATTTVTATEIAAWAEKNGVAFDAGTTIPVNALIFNVAPAAVPADPVAAADAILEDLASKVDISKMTAGTLDAATLELLAKEYPMANISLKEVTDDIAGEEATNTHLFTLVIELK